MDSMKDALKRKMQSSKMKADDGPESDEMAPSLEGSPADDGDPSDYSEDAPVDSSMSLDAPAQDAASLVPAASAAVGDDTLQKILMALSDSAGAPSSLGGMVAKGAQDKMAAMKLPIK